MTKYFKKKDASATIQPRIRINSKIQTENLLQKARNKSNQQSIILKNPSNLDQEN